MSSEIIGVTKFLFLVLVIAFFFILPVGIGVAYEYGALSWEDAILWLLVVMIYTAAESDSSN